MIDMQTISIVGTVAGFAGLFVTATWKLSKDISSGNEKIYTRLATVESNALNRTELLERNVQETYRGKDLCDERHESVGMQLEVLTEAVNEVKEDVKTILRKNGFNKK